MKKILSIMLLVVMTAITASAQRATVMPLVAGDTIVNAATVNKVFTATAGYSGVAIQPVVSKISGTVAGKVYLYESLDGTNYTAAVDSITLSNVATNGSIIWKRTTPVPVYYKVSAVGSGTMSAVLTVKYVARKSD